MVTMTVEPIGIYTIEDLERSREHDDRLRWELLDGELVVTPSPRTIHQSIAFRLGVRIDQVAPDGTELFVAPLDVRLDERNVLQPDLLLAEEATIEDEFVSAAPILAVEILSPSTRRRDLVTKLDILQRAGCPHYWVIDPADASVRIWELVSGAYRLVIHAHGDEQVTVSEPVHLSFAVNDLISPRWRVKDAGGGCGAPRLQRGS